MKEESKKKSIKLATLLIILVVLLLVVGTISYIIIKTKTNDEINDENIDFIKVINNNSKLPVKYMSKYNALDNAKYKSEGYEYLSNFMSYDFKKDNISFSYYGYPTNESEKYLGKITISDDKYNILGVTVGDNYQDSIKKIESYGFERIDGQLNHEDIFEANLKYKDFNIKIET